jgi:multidrug efflux pump subunit AcrA (membrane-fusion protein)
MKVLGERRVAVAAVAGLIVLAVAGWLAAQSIRSPAQVAADTAAPRPSAITVPVVRRSLATKVIVRGTVRYGAPQAVALATSQIKLTASDILTRAPRRNAHLGAGDVAANVDGRPVFVLPGGIPMHRDLGPGMNGPDVRQLETALSGLGFSPGAVDGTYDASTESAVSAFYLSKDWDPFGPTDADIEKLRTAQSTAAQARDMRLQALNTLEQARRGLPPGDLTQAKIDALTARDARDSAALNIQIAQQKLAAAKATVADGSSAETIAAANQKRDQALADADVSSKRAAVNQAIDDERIARARQNEVAIEAPPSEREAASAAVRQAADNVVRARADLDASTAAADAVRTGGPAALQQAKSTAAANQRDVQVAQAELRRAQIGITTARQLAQLSTIRAKQLATPTDTQTLKDIAVSALNEEQRTNAEARRISRGMGVKVPANEILFFPSLPLRVDKVKLQRGGLVTGALMDVTNSNVAIDSSLSASDVRLVRAGNPVVIGEDTLGVSSRGRVTQVATEPGTNRVDPTRFYFSVIPDRGLLGGLIGASVKLTIDVKTTQGKVLAVPVSALSVGSDGDSRLQVRRGGLTTLVTVVPGLAAGGLVEVRPVGGGSLSPGDQVVVGSAGRSGSSGAGSPRADASGGAGSGA